MRAIVVPSKRELQAQAQSIEHAVYMTVGNIFDIDALAYISEYGPVPHGTLYGKYKHDFEMQLAFRRLKCRELVIAVRKGNNYSYALTDKGKEVLSYIRQKSQKQHFT